MEGTENVFTTGALTLHVAIEKFALEEPLHIAGYSMVDTDVVTVSLEEGGYIGRVEAFGVLKRIEAARARI